MTQIDPHSYTDSDHPKVQYLSLRLQVDFEKHTLAGVAELRLGESVAGALDLDTRGLAISEISNQKGVAITWQLEAEDPILGSRLRLSLPAATTAVSIHYSTSADSSALQWLTREQTAGKKHPFLFSQCQAIHARALAPLQDSPRRRITYDAAITVPDELTAVMSAGPAGEATAPSGHRTFLFEMPQPIPPYLLALAVGDLASRDLSPRSRVWAEPEVIEAAAHEFAEIEPIIQKAEGMFGPYDWDRYDMLVLPPSFPYGGMENPRMTFLTPTLISGDRSLVAVVAHELAHSWTGNLVTNATAEHFWLNEGFTVYAERRIVEAVWGEKEAALQWAIGEKALQEAIARFGADSPHTCLRTNLTGIDPDEVFSSIPYEKGSRFLVCLERHAGRERFDKFLLLYMERFRFTSITTEEFLLFLEEQFPGAAAAVDAQTWLYEPGLPANAPVFSSESLLRVADLANRFTAGVRVELPDWDRFSPSEKLVYLQKLPRPLPAADLDWLEFVYHLNGQGNHEILVEWLAIAAASGYKPAFARLREVLVRVGRMKYLRPLYGALGATPETRALAREIFAEASPGYHGLSRRVVAGILEKYAKDELA
jgi:leukotriene A-4 hydrolase/aminopeptidase